MTTTKATMIIPEVLSALIDRDFGSRISLLPVTEIDRSLEGTPGDTLKFPCFRYIGKAEIVPENGEVALGTLSADTTEATVKKYAKAVCITDEARLSGFGDPVGEAGRQLAAAIDHALDEALYEQLNALPLSRKCRLDTLSSDGVADALTLFGEELDGEKLLLTDAAGFAALRRDPAYIRASDMGQRMICSGVVGEIWGCQILLTNRLKGDPAKAETSLYILKPGALRLISKQNTVLEVQRDPAHMRDTLYASRHAAAYLYDAGRAIALTRFTGVEQLDEAGFAVKPAEGGVLVEIDGANQAPLHMKWGYTLSETPAAMPVFGETVPGLRDWPGSQTVIAPGAFSWLNLYLTDSEGRPVKALSLEVIV